MSYEKPRLVEGGHRVDPRVEAVLEVLAGEGVGEVARRWEVETALLHRWVTAFVDAGTAQVTNRPAGDVERQRDRFLAAFAHETRTPLASARGWVDLLRDGDIPQPMVESTLAKLHDSLTRLAERSRDVELLAAASLGLVRVRATRVTVGELLAGHDLPGGADAAAVLMVDPELMGRVVRDLWTAAQLPPAPDDTRVEVGHTGPWTELRVVRRGPPLDPGTLQTLFEPFDLNSDGSGITIGLYLARALAVAHGGAVGVEQDERSTAFWVRVPQQPTGVVPAADPKEHR